MASKLMPFLWLVLVGAKVFGYYAYTETFYLEGPLVGTGAAYSLVVFRKELARLLFFREFRLAGALLAVPLVLLPLSERHAVRSDYTFPLLLVLTFATSAAIGSRPGLRGTVTAAVFVVVALGTALNLYELFIEPNRWSTAPGRSSGFYSNPNNSAEALVGYGCIFVVLRTTRFGAWDTALVALTLLGVFPTFSRAGCAAALVLLPAAVFWRVRAKHLPRMLIGALAAASAVVLCVGYALNTVELSEGASTRLDSLAHSGGVADYEAERGHLFQNSLQLAMTHPWLGNGVFAAVEMGTMPHNTFMSVLVKYGAVGLAVFLLFLIRMLLTARGADRQASGIIWFYVGWLAIFGLSSDGPLENASTVILLGFAVARACEIQSCRNTKNLLEDDKAAASPKRSGPRRERKLDHEAVRKRTVR